MNLNHTITDVPGISIGHAQDNDAITGCTVILCENGAVGGVDQRGGAPGTRETDALHPMHLVDKVHAVMLAGGSAFGLDAASGAVRFLEERGMGFDVGVAKVPIVPAAILFDLGIGRADIRPGAEMGYQACLNASRAPVEEGCAGAGTGATVGKILGMGQAMKSGIGSSSIYLGEGIVVGAIAAVNAFGDVVDPMSGEIIAGVRSVQKGPVRIGEAGTFAGTMNIMKSLVGKAALYFATRQNTVIGVVATNAKLDKEQVNKMAQMAQDGLARSIRPAHTMLDGDTIFALSTGQRIAGIKIGDVNIVDASIIGAFAAEAFAEAVVRAVRSATPSGGLPAASSQ